MSSKSILIISFLVFVLKASAINALTLVSPAPIGELNLEKKGGILDQLYGMDNLMHIADDFDQNWKSLNGIINASAKARFAAFTFNFGYHDAVGFHALFNTIGSQFDVSGSLNFVTALPTFHWILEPSGAPKWSSSISENSDIKDHMVTYLITSGISAGNYVIAWEDLLYLGDKDYNDLVIEIHGAAPVSSTPEPNALLLFGVGTLIMLGYLKRRF